MSIIKYKLIGKIFLQKMVMRKMLKCFKAENACNFNLNYLLKAILKVLVKYLHSQSD